MTVAGAEAVGKARSRAGGVASAAEFRAVLDDTLAAVDADDGLGTRLRASGVRLRLEITDLALVLNVASDEDEPHLTWTFSDEVAWSPRLELWMDSEIANAYLQGKASLAIAIARRRVRCRGDARTAVLYVPALKLLAKPYERVVAAGHPHLLLERRLS
jgi:hypothetical protein